MILSLSLNFLFSFTVISKLSAIDLFYLSACSLFLRPQWKHLHQCVDSEHFRSKYFDHLTFFCFGSLGGAASNCMNQIPGHWIQWENVLQGHIQEQPQRGVQQSQATAHPKERKTLKWGLDLRSSAPNTLPQIHSCLYVCCNLNPASSSDLHSCLLTLPSSGMREIIRRVKI